MPDARLVHSPVDHDLPIRGAGLGVPFLINRTAVMPLALYALAAGAFAVASYFFGDMALEIAESGGFHSDIAEAHEALGEAVAVAFAIWALIRLGLWWRDLRLAGGGAFAVALVEVAGAALVVVTAYYGGQLVYDLGVNVAHAAG